MWYKLQLQIWVQHVLVVFAYKRKYYTYISRKYLYEYVSIGFSFLSISINHISGDLIICTLWDFIYAQHIGCCPCNKRDLVFHGDVVIKEPLLNVYVSVSWYNVYTYSAHYIYTTYTNLCVCITQHNGDFAAENHKLVHGWKWSDDGLLYYILIWLLLLYISFNAWMH